MIRPESDLLNESYGVPEDAHDESYPTTEIQTINGLSARERLALQPRGEGSPAQRSVPASTMPVLAALSPGAMTSASKVTRLSLDPVLAVDDLVFLWFLLVAAGVFALVGICFLLSSLRRTSILLTTVSVALILFVVIDMPARAATFAERDDFIAEYVADRVQPDPKVDDGFANAGPGEVRVYDGFAHEPVLIREAVIAFVDRHGYPEPPPPPDPVVVSAAEFSAPSSGAADWYAIADCEGGGNWGMVKPDADPYYFVLQFHPTTWLGYGGTQAELDAGVAPSPARLIEVAENVLAGQGPGAWPNCFRWA